MRFDVWLYKSEVFGSRQKAKEAIISGVVCLNNNIITKPSASIIEWPKPLVQLDSIKRKSHTNAKYVSNNALDECECGICVEILEKRYVSRSAYKLKHFLDSINFSSKNGFSAIDVGTSRGGFSEVFLERGARVIYCVDVGKNQLHSTIKNNPRIVSIENCDIRDFTTSIAIPQNLKFDVLVCDVSFIGIRHIFPSLKILSDEMILLFKPQFEVGKHIKRDKKGVVIDNKAKYDVLWNFIDFLTTEDFKIIALKSSAIKGKNGNEEFFIHTKKQ